MLACYLKHNKSVYKKFKKECMEEGDSESEKAPKKRQRANSNVSAASSTKGKKTAKASKKSSSKASEGVMTRRKSSSEWQPNPDHAIKANAKEFKFQRIDESKFTGLTGAAKDNSYEAKALFG